MLAGAVYVMVRGFDNFQQGQRAAKEKAAARRPLTTPNTASNSSVTTAPIWATLHEQTWVTSGER